MHAYPHIHIIVPGFLNCYIWYLFSRDDTVLPSTVLMTNGVTLQRPDIPDALEAELRPLKDQIIELLEYLKSTVKHFYIVTNAEVRYFVPFLQSLSRLFPFLQNTWVELSCQYFIPEVLPYLNGIPIISARSTYENLFPGQPNMVSLFFFPLFHSPSYY